MQFLPGRQSNRRIRKLRPEEMQKALCISRNYKMPGRSFPAAHTLPCALRYTLLPKREPESAGARHTGGRPGSCCVFVKRKLPHAVISSKRASCASSSLISFFRHLRKRLCAARLQWPYIQILCFCRHRLFALSPLICICPPRPLHAPCGPEPTGQPRNKNAFLSMRLMLSLKLLHATLL